MTVDATLRHTTYSLLVPSSQPQFKNQDTPQITTINPLLLKVYCNPINALLDKFCLLRQLQIQFKTQVWWGNTSAGSDGCFRWGYKSGLVLEVFKLPSEVYHKSSWQRAEHADEWKAEKLEESWRRGRIHASGLCYWERQAASDSSREPPKLLSLGNDKRIHVYCLGFAFEHIQHHNHIFTYSIVNKQTVKS